MADQLVTTDQPDGQYAVGELDTQPQLKLIVTIYKGGVAASTYALFAT